MLAIPARRYGDPNGARIGAWLQLENFGALRYERGVTEQAGRAVLQRHEAGQQDVANAEGQGRVVSPMCGSALWSACLPLPYTAHAVLPFISSGVHGWRHWHEG